MENYPEIKTFLKPDANGNITLPSNAWNTPTFPAPVRQKPPGPKSLETVLAEIDAAGLAITEAQEKYSRERNTDLNSDRKAQLVASWQTIIQVIHCVLREVLRDFSQCRGKNLRTMRGRDFRERRQR